MKNTASWSVNTPVISVLCSAIAITIAGLCWLSPIRAERQDPKPQPEQNAAVTPLPVKGSLLLEKVAVVEEKNAIIVKFDDSVKDTVRHIDFRTYTLTRYDQKGKQFQNNEKISEDILIKNISDLRSFSYLRDGSFNFTSPRGSGYMFDCVFSKIGTYVVVLIATAADGSRFETFPLLVQVSPPEKNGKTEIKDDWITK